MRVIRGCSLSLLMGILVGLPVALPADRSPTDRERFKNHALSQKGDVDRGRALFSDQERAACVRCHRVGGKGGEVGPDLSDIGSKLDRAHLIESVIEPSRTIVEGYRPNVVALVDGRVLSGLVKSESEEVLVLVDGEAQEHAVPKTTIEQRAYADASLMPDGLSAGLSPEEFTDLVAYLESLRSARQPTPGSGVTGPLDLPPGFSAEKVAGGLTATTAMAITPDGRILICEQTGSLRVVKEGILRPSPMLTVKVDSYWERGLIGVTLDPRFVDNGYLYVCYVSPHPYPHHRISRFTIQEDVAVPGSEVVLFEGDDQRTLGGNIPAGHQGGALHFGEDGKLYVALGEQTAGAPSQSLNSLLGKMLRLNSDGSIPEDNPFYAKAKGKYRAIWALGLRNPFTFAVQSETGRIFINDVGGKAEEINEGRPGANYGWPAVEHGPTDDSRYQGPIDWYPTASISGGDFCPVGPGVAFPSEFQGKYFFMDFVKGWIKVIDPDDTRRPAREILFASGLARPVDLRFAKDGSLYVLIRDAWVRDDTFQPHTGSLHRIRYR